MTSYFLQRIANVLLREDVGECLSQGLLEHTAQGSWLKVKSHEANTWLKLPVLPCEHMQPWMWDSTRPLLLERDGSSVPVEDPAACVHALLPSHMDEERACLADFERELKTAEAHRVHCQTEQTRFFQTSKAPADSAPWDEKLLHHERLAAFLDHPYYPTARAKVGFGLADLEQYTAEFCPTFELRWLALPRTELQLHGEARPSFWPSFADVGLPDALQESHALVPVHPHTWTGLWDLPELASLLSQAHAAPQAFLNVTPTLSVRTVALVDHPRWHLKLPLRIRTLGTRNIRTIKPSTLVDGHRIQSFLAEQIGQEPRLGERILFTHEEQGGAVDGQTMLGYLLRRYPSTLSQETVVSVAGLCALLPDGRLVAEQLAEQFYQGQLQAFFNAYATLTLELHLRLWVRYGVALESNQQNSLLVLSPDPKPLRLLLKDNDAPRILPERLARHAGGTALAEALKDRRILCEDDDALARMFLTITLQLNLSALVEALAQKGLLPREQLYGLVRERTLEVLNVLASEGEEVSAARRWLLEAPLHPVKYLLTAATLRPKTQTLAADVNKFYGLTGPNPLRPVGP